MAPIVHSFLYNYGFFSIRVSYCMCGIVPCSTYRILLLTLPSNPSQTSVSSLCRSRLPSLPLSRFGSVTMTDDFTEVTARVLKYYKDRAQEKWRKE